MNLAQNKEGVFNYDFPKVKHLTCEGAHQKFKNLTIDQITIYPNYEEQILKELREGYWSMFYYIFYSYYHSMK